MRKRYYDVGTFIYLRSQKRGLETAAIIGIGLAASSAVAGTASAISQKKAQEEANATNIQLQHEAMQQQEKLFYEGNRFNHGEAVDARNFNANESRINRQFQEEMLDKTMQWYEDYNSPSAQYQRYIDAGLNPTTLSGNMGTSPAFSVPSGAAASASPASAMSAPSVPQAHVDPAGLDISKVISQSLGDAASIFGMEKTKAETENLVTDNDIKQASKGLDLEIKSQTIDKLKSDINYNNTLIDQTKKKMDEISATINNLNQSTKLMSVEAAGKELDNFFHSQEYEQILNKMKQDYKISREIADAQLKLMASEMFKNRQDGLAAASQARYYNALSDVQPHYAKYLDAYKSLLQQERGIAETKNYLDVLFGTQEREQGLKIGKEQYERARYENTTFFRMINAGQSTMNMMGNAFITYKGASFFMK